MRNVNIIVPIIVIPTGKRVYINYEECKYAYVPSFNHTCTSVYINYEECKCNSYVNSCSLKEGFILTMRNVNVNYLVIELIK